MINQYLAQQMIYGSTRLGAENGGGEALANETWATLPATSSYYQTIGDKRYELANHLGNVLNTVTDRKLPRSSSTTVAYYTADVKSYADYYPFGMQFPNKRMMYTPETDGDYANEGGYRYGFQGQEKDDEIKGEGNSVNYKYRMHDPRIGRFFAVDPLSKEYAYYSPYSFSGNKVIAWGELEGLEEYYRADGSYIGSIANSREMRVINFSEVEKNINYAIRRESKFLTNTNEYQYDVDFALKNSSLMFDVNSVQKLPPSDRLGNNSNVKTFESAGINKGKKTEFDRQGYKDNNVEKENGYDIGRLVDDEGAGGEPVFGYGDASPLNYGKVRIRVDKPTTRTRNIYRDPYPDWDSVKSIPYIIEYRDNPYQEEPDSAPRFIKTEFYEKGGNGKKTIKRERVQE